MTQITIDIQTGEKLRGLSEPVELIDENGQVIGTFQPALMPPYDPTLIPPMDAAERRRRAADDHGLSTGEVLQHLPQTRSEASTATA